MAPALAFLAKKVKENLFLLPLEYLRLHVGFSEYYKYVSDPSQEGSSEPPQSVLLEKHLPLSDHQRCMLPGASTSFLLRGDRNGQNASQALTSYQTENCLSDNKTSASPKILSYEGK